MDIVNKLTDIIPLVEDKKAIVFDLDDTLYNEKDYVRSGFSAVARMLPMVENAQEKLWRAFELKQPAIDVVLQDEGIKTEALLNECVNVYREHCPKIYLDQEIREMLQEFRKSGRLLGIITDGRVEGQRQKIKSLGIIGLVDNIIITDELGGVKCRKPNPKAFMLMRDKFCCNYSDMVYIGDNTEKDFLAPNELGMATILYKNKNGLYFKQ